MQGKLTTRPIAAAAAVLAMSLLLTGCGSGFGQNEMDPETRRQLEESGALLPQDRDTIWDLFSDNDNPNVTVEVNRYLWQASLEILDFMPIEAADPFSGVISFGYGTPPGGSQSYRATVFVTDPALEARSLRVARAVPQRRRRPRDRAPDRGRHPDPRASASHPRRSPIDPFIMAP
jgi:hypothetical protein